MPENDVQENKKGMPENPDSKSRMGVCPGKKGREKRMKRPYFRIGVSERVLPGTSSFLNKLKEDFKHRLREEAENAGCQGREVFHKTFAALRDSLREIFEAEETLMIRTRYPDYDLQHHSHNSFRGQLRETQALEYHPCLSGHLFHFMDSWLHQHEILSDVHFFRYLSEWEKKHPPCGFGAEGDWQSSLLDLHPDLALLPTKIIHF